MGVYIYTRSSQRVKLAEIFSCRFLKNTSKGATSLLASERSEQDTIRGVQIRAGAVYVYIYIYYIGA